MVDWIHPRKCEYCGKSFECQQEYRYKIPQKPGKEFFYWFCSYSCLQKYRTEHETPEKPTPKQQQIIDLLNSGLNITQTAARLGISLCRVSIVKGRWPQYLRR